MKQNYETCLIGEKVILVPYRPEHVQKYHEWMLSPFLLEMTGSEPLSLDEEIKMQESWKHDETKCTFIVLAKDLCHDIPTSSILDTPASMTMTMTDNDNVVVDGDGQEECRERDFILRNLNAMIGDVNLFLSEIESEEEQDDENDECVGGQETKIVGTEIQSELDVMIAEETYQRKGLGREASLMMMLYGAKTLGIQRFFVKIKEENLPSLKLFQVLGFHEYDYAACFKEFEYELRFDSSEAMTKSIEETYTHPMHHIKSPVKK
mmetsp:Transcript_6935/g.8773  ORF Transcript_6935/g.8773 Transcript_6935/m.8773 type:complete len:264 (+) Transcript_6935:65-856(+)